MAEGKWFWRALFKMEDEANVIMWESNANITLILIDTVLETNTSTYVVLRQLHTIKYI